MRVAAAEQQALDARYRNSVADAASRNAQALLPEVEQLASLARPVLAMPVWVARDLTKAGKYRNYYQRIRGSERQLATTENHSDRVMVDVKLFPGFQEDVQFLALSVDGKAPRSYGAVAMRLKSDLFLDLRASLLERNSFLFFEEHQLGRLRAAVPAGYRADWAGRIKLVVIKIATRLTSSTASSELPRMFLNDMNDRKLDEFVEVHVFAGQGIALSEFDQACLQEALAVPEDQLLWAEVQSACRRANISVIS